MLGWPSVSWGLNQISAYELAEWKVYAKLEPFGAEWENVLFAMLATLIANSNRDPKKRTKPFDLKDFMLIQDEEKSSQIGGKLKSLREQLGD